MRALAATLRGTVVVPGDGEYESSRKVWNRAVNLRPAAIVRCADVDDIVRTIDFAQVNRMPLAVRSGGHSQAGHGTCEGGVVLDLAALRAVDVDSTRRVVKVSSGARVADVIRATQAHGLLTPMGSCPDVGIGGLTLGGGENFLMAKYGVVCDNVRAAQVVTADGRTLTASDHENADLFWAIRGGGGNFGVVTWFDYQLHDVGEVLSGRLQFPISGARDTMRRYRSLIADPPDELDTSCGIAELAEGPVFSIALSFCGKRREGERIIADFRAALDPQKDTVAWAPYSADMEVPAAPSAGTGLFLDDLTDDVIDAFADAIPGAPRATTASFSHFHGAVSRVRPDAMAFPLRRPGFDFFVSVAWTSEPERAAAGAWMKALARSLRPFGAGVYVNNLNDEEQSRVAEAYGPNYERLAAIKRRYDPSNLFHVNHNVQPEAAGPGRGP
jgi:hypothetical protein